ncbi:hypothetical protein ACFL2K_03750 [Candidatus Margulisiibacteriota bacterium]
MNGLVRIQKDIGDFKIIISAIKYIFQIGITSKLNEESKRKIILTNKISFLLLVFTLGYLIIFYFLGYGFHSFLTLPFAFVFFSILLFNKIGLHTVSKVLFMATSVFGITIFSTAFGKEAGVQIVFCALLILPFLLFEDNQKDWMNFCVTLPFTGIFFLTYFDYTFLPKFEASNKIILFFNLSISLVSFIIVIASIRFFLFHGKKSFS